jgi:arginase
VGFAIVEVPAMAGDPGHPAALGPAVISAALQDAGCVLASRRVSVGAPAGGMVSDSIRAGMRVREVVSAVVANGDVPLVLAGSCDVAPAVVAGIERPGLAVIWLDAHADFNTPRSSVSGFWPGMTLAVLVGDCGENVWSALGRGPVAAERVLLIGVRRLSPEEESRRLQQSALHVIPWRDGLPEKDLDAALAVFGADVEDVYLHLDLDALDPSVGTGVVDPPVAGGLSSSQLADVITKVRERLTIAGATIATYTPDKDDGQTLAVTVDVIRHLMGRGR